MDVLNIPNTLTLLRIVAIPFFAAMMIYHRYDIALAVFVLASITDALDGLIARVTNKQTKLGQFLDPMADKFLLITSFILFTIYGWIPAWLTISIISRDLIVLVGWMLFYLIHHVVFIRPSMLGKSAIAAQMVLLAYVLLRINFQALLPDPALLVWVTTILTVASGLYYIVKGLMYTNG
ncbi:MAG: CDP-alcohol phosphatidyltransferase family protein [Candidatus Magnetominusculus sp. LBB02]|nr:CDP-alcohol phosphatidyltransferase family protein [Candidatus Magnetominusculus sp. LBB02]